MPKGLQKIQFSFGAEGLTRFGGISLFQQFCKFLSLRYFLQHKIKWPIYGNKVFHPVDLFLTYLFVLVSGVGRVENAKSLVSNGLLPSLLGLRDFPHHDTIRDFLWRFNPKSFESLKTAHDKFRHYAFEQLGPIYSSIVDIDTTVLPVYGHQQGSRVGYNPGHRGKPSYCPVISSEERQGLTLNFELRAGNVHPSADATAFLQSTLDKLPKTVSNTRTRIRADASFYGKEFINYLDDNGLGYVIVTRVTKPVKNILCGISYKPFRDNWDVGEFQYQPCFWKNKHRFIGVRHLIKENDLPTTLFAVKGFTYRALVTNLELNPQAVWKFYCERALQELLIKELKNNYALAKIPTRSFLANQVYLEIVLWAYDLVMMFKHLCLPPKCQNWTLSTLRRDLWLLPAELVHPGHRNCLRLPERFPNQDVFQYVRRAVTKVKPLM